MRDNQRDLEAGIQTDLNGQITYGGYLHVLSATDLQPLVPRRLTTGGWLVGLAVSPNGDHLASLGSDGDLLLWDNRCSSHARMDFPSNERRLMLRTQITGSVKPY